MRVVSYTEQCKDLNEEEKKTNQMLKWKSNGIEWEIFVDDFNFMNFDLKKIL